MCPAIYSTPAPTSRQGSVVPNRSISTRKMWPTGVALRPIRIRRARRARRVVEPGEPDKSYEPDEPGEPDKSYQPDEPDKSYEPYEPEPRARAVDREH